jgi:hypothetical protein
MLAATHSRAVEIGVAFLVDARATDNFRRHSAYRCAVGSGIFSAWPRADDKILGSRISIATAYSDTKI